VESGGYSEIRRFGGIERVGLPSPGMLLCILFYDCESADIEEEQTRPSDLSACLGLLHCECCR
jgi:hypothetical protein